MSKRALICIWPFQDPGRNHNAILLSYVTMEALEVGLESRFSSTEMQDSCTGIQAGVWCSPSWDDGWIVHYLCHTLDNNHPVDVRVTCWKLHFLAQGRDQG